jgi:predicted ArsR family transcriptional regulator
MVSTPNRIRQYFHTHPPATALDLSNALGMTVQNVRHHLARLVRDGWIETCGEKKAEGRGRTAVLYRLNPTRVPNNVSILVDALLSGLHDLPAEFQERILRSTAEQIAHPTGALPKKPFAHLNRVIERLNQLNYNARWEARPDGPHVILGRQPYPSLPEAYPDLEVLDRYVVEALLIARVQPAAGPSRKGQRDQYQDLLVLPDTT